jgi:hypothetical protein
MAGYLGASPVPQTIQKKQSFTATASQTTFTTTGYTDGAFINVYLNGVRLINGTDYTATNGSDIVLTTGASASDVLDFETFNEFTLVDQTLETPTFRTSATLKNDTEEDTDGGRESTLIFKGEQSGGEISTLAEIEASHDGTADDEKGDLIFRTNDGSDGSSPTEAARIDSGQNLLVGKAVTSSSTQGIALQGNGQGVFTSDGGTGALFNRKTSDGGIVEFRKDGTSVGTISSRLGANLLLTSAGGSVYTDDNFRPNADNAYDLGLSTLRFNDLYLGGGAYLGGTVAANKLDDYEEGTFTYTLVGSTSGGWTSRTGYTTGRYTKIGQLVTVQIRYESTTRNSPQGTLQMSGLPFATADHPTNGNGSGQVPVLLRGNSDSSVASHFVTYGNSSTSLSFFTQDQGQSSISAVNAATDTTGQIEGTISFSYVTAS